MTGAASDEALNLLEQMQRYRTAGRPSDVIDCVPTDDAALRRVAQALDTIGVEAYNGNLLDRAHDAFYLLFLCRLKIVERDPGARASIRDFASAEDLLGTVLIDLGNIEAAEQLLPESLRYREGLHQDDPSDAHASYLYGQSLWRMSTLSLAKQDFAAEADFVQQAREHLAVVDGTWPGVHFIETLRREIEERWSAIRQAPPAGTRG